MVEQHSAGNRGGRVTRLPGRSLRMLMIVAGVSALAGCSTAPEWARPGFIYGDENAAAATAAPSGIEAFPELADVPERRSPSTTPEERAEMRRELSGEQDRAKRTDQILEEGGSTIAPPLEDLSPPGDGAALAPNLNRFGDGFAVSRAPHLAPWALEAAGPVVAARYRETHGLRWTPPAPARAVAGPPISVNLAALDYLPGRPGPALAKAAWGGTDMVALVDPARVAETVAVGAVDPAFADQGGPGDAPPYVVFFDHGSAAVTDADRDMLAQAADAQREHGGVLRIVGHASSRVGSLMAGQDKLVNFKMSLSRASAVAQELIRRGADPAQVIVEARGDGNLAYIETMPEGEAGNRRAEIFLEFGEGVGAPLMTGSINRS